VKPQRQPKLNKLVMQYSIPQQGCQQTSTHGLFQPTVILCILCATISMAGASETGSSEIQSAEVTGNRPMLLTLYNPTASPTQLMATYVSFAVVKSVLPSRLLKAAMSFEL